MVFVGRRPSRHRGLRVEMGEKRDSAVLKSGLQTLDVAETALSPTLGMITPWVVMSWGNSGRSSRTVTRSTRRCEMVDLTANPDWRMAVTKMVSHVSTWRDRWSRSRQAEMVALEGRNYSSRDCGKGRVGDWRASWAVVDGGRRKGRVGGGPESAGLQLRHVRKILWGRKLPRLPWVGQWLVRPHVGHCTITIWMRFSCYDNGFHLSALPIPLYSSITASSDSRLHEVGLPRPDKVGVTPWE
jgi:hypothetical protein